MGLPDTVAGVALHAFVMPLAYAVVCAVITWSAVKIPGVRAVFGEGGPRNPHTLPRPPWPSRRRRPRPRDPGPRDPADAASRTGTDSVQPPRRPRPRDPGPHHPADAASRSGTDSVQPPRRVRAPEPDLGAPPDSVD